MLAKTPNPSAKFNDHTVQNIKNKFTVKFIEMFAQKYTYDPLSFTANVSVFNSDYQLLNELDQGVVGTSLATDIKISDNYLYDEAVYDSEIEHEILRQVVPDSEAPTMTIELKVLKDADALDRVRLGDLDTSYLRTDVATGLVGLAEDLYQVYLDNKVDDAFDAVFGAALALGVVEGGEV